MSGKAPDQQEDHKDEHEQQHTQKSCKEENTENMKTWHVLYKIKQEIQTHENKETAWRTTNYMDVPCFI